MRISVAAAIGALVFAAAADAQIDQVTIAGRAVDDPGAFRELVDLRERTEPPPSEAKSVLIVVQPSGFSGAQRLEYFPLEEVVRRKGEWFDVEDDLAERIEDELASQAGEGRSSWPAYLSLFALLGGGGTAVWLMWGRRRWRARAT